MVIGHLTENPCQIAKDSRVSSTDPCLSVFIGSFIFSHFLAVRRGGDHERPETMVGHRVGSVTLLRGGSIAKENGGVREALDRKSTRLNSSHGYISYAVFCLTKKTARDTTCASPPPARQATRTGSTG